MPESYCSASDGFDHGVGLSRGRRDRQTEHLEPPSCIRALRARHHLGGAPAEDVRSLIAQGVVWTGGALEGDDTTVSPPSIDASGSTLSLGSVRYGPPASKYDSAAVSLSRKGFAWPGRFSSISQLAWRMRSG
jgi:hypothetical protein